MMNFNKGDRVVLMENASIYANGKDLSKTVGEIVNTFDGINIAIVKFDEDVIKIPTMFLIPAPADKNQNEEGKAQAVQLTHDDFKDLTIKFTSLKYLEDLFEGEEIDKGGLVEFASVAAIILDNLEDIIFGEAVDD